MRVKCTPESPEAWAYRITKTVSLSGFILNSPLSLILFFLSISLLLHKTVSDTLSRMPITTLAIQGMTCGACSSSITNQLTALPGVNTAAVSLITEEARVEHASSISPESLQEAIEDCGFDAQVLQSRDTPLSPDATASTSTSDNDQIVETLISVKGMTCGACTSSVTSVLEELPGVVSASVSLITEQASVKHENSVNTNTLIDAIEDCGFDASFVQRKQEDHTPLMENTTFDVNTLARIDELESVDGILSTAVEGPGSLSIKYDPSVLGVRDLIKVMASIEIHATPENIVSVTSQMDSLNKLKEIQFWKWNFIKTTIVGLPLFLIHHLLETIGIHLSLHLWHGIFLESIVELILGTYIQFTVGVFFWRNAKNSFKHGSGTMDTLVCISTNISYYFSILIMVISFANNKQSMPPHTLFETAVLLMNFVSLGKWLESKAKSETSASLSKLISLTSDSCTIVENPTAFDAEKGVVSGNLITIPINYLQVHDIVDIKPGEKIPADGVIIHGESEVDESLLTGESLPIAKHKNDKVIGGSINGIGHIFVKVLTTSENSQLANIIKLVKSAQMNRAPIQSYADFIASIFVPAILILSVFTFVCWIIICNTVKTPPPVFNDMNGKLFVCLQIAISVIVVACPCALGLAAPTAIMVGTGVGASHGVLIKGGDVLEAANDLDVVLFDKTGTLTVGEMVVRNCKVLGQIPRDTVLAVAGCLETMSEHPVARAIVEYTQKQVGIENFDGAVENFEAEVGKGISATINFKGKNYKVQVGNLKMFTEEFLQTDTVFTSLKIESDCTVAHIVIDGAYQGFMELQDVVKEDSQNVISFLRSQGLDVAMVTGDTQRSANRIAKQVNIPLRNVYADVSPQGKEQLVKDFQSRGMKVAFVGDGINDSPALATADVGIAISSGTDIALEAADIVLLNNETTIQGVSSALSLASRTLNKIKWNFFWSSVYNLTMVPLAMGVLIPWGIQLSPLVAGLSMAFSSVSVVLSSLWLKRWTPPNLDSVSLNDDITNEVDIESGERKKWSLTSSVRNVLRTKKTNSSDIELQSGLLRSA